MKTTPVALALTAALLAGCAAVKPAQTEAVLRVDPPLPTPAALPGQGAADRLSLLAVSASGTAAGRRYAYIDPAAPREVRQAATLFWEEPPPVLVQRALERGLSARLGTPLLTTAEAAGGARRLGVNVDRFEEEAGASAAAVVALTATVTEGGTRALVSTACYAARRPIASAAPSDRARAFEAALGAVMDDMARDLARVGAARQAAAC